MPSQLLSMPIVFQLSGIPSLAVLVQSPPHPQTSRPFGPEDFGVEDALGVDDDDDAVSELHPNTKVSARRLCDRINFRKLLGFHIFLLPASLR